MSLPADWKKLKEDEKALNKRLDAILREGKALDARRRELKKRQNVAEGRKEKQFVFKGLKIV